MPNDDDLLERLKKLEEEQPLPPQWRMTGYCASALLICLALYMAWELDLRWWAMIPFLMAFPPVTIGAVTFLGVKFLGRPKNWKPEDTPEK